MIINPDFRALENIVLATICEMHPADRAALESQLAMANVRRRENTGAGFYIHLEVQTDLAHLAQPYWGKGLASEAAPAWLQAAFCELHLKRLTAIVHPENVASIRVLAKLRFREDRRDTVLGMNSIIFSIDVDAHAPAEPTRTH